MTVVVVVVVVTAITVIVAVANVFVSSPLLLPLPLPPAAAVAVAAAATVAALAAVRRGVCCICNCSGLWNLRRHECLQLGNVVVLIGCKPFVSSPLFCQQREPGREVSSGGWCNAHELDTAPTSA